MSPATGIALGPGGEFDAIRRMLERWGALAVGVGDDAAAFDVPRGERLVVSTDTALDGTHFRREWLSAREIAYRAVTASLSDLAAMAAAPLGVVVALQVPADDPDLLDALSDGIGDAVRAAGTVIRGGNLAAAPRLAITTTVFGSAFTPLWRNGARDGDTVYVTGRLGGPAAALRAFEAGRQPAAAHRDRFARPVARIAEARWLAGNGASAAIDVSDGLAGDAGHLAAASGAHVEIALDAVPTIDGAEADDALGGEEYELIVTGPSSLPAKEFLERFGVPLTRVGVVHSGVPEASFTRAGRRVAAPRAWDHFSR